MSINIPAFPDILSEITVAWTNALGAGLDFDPSTPNGQYASVLAASYQSLYQILQEAFSASRVDQAQGLQLDDLVALLNIKRQSGQKTVCKSCALTGTDGVMVPAGSLAQTTDGLIFYSSSEVTFAGGLATVDFISQDYGQFSVPIGALSAPIPNPPIPGWLTVTNPTAGQDGATAQSDAELRRSVLTRSQNLAKGYEGTIKGNIEGIAGILQAYVYINYSNATSSAPWSIPAHGILCVIDYPDRTLDLTIADTILSVIPPVLTYSSPAGGTQVTQAASWGSISINWNIAAKTPVNFKIQVIQEATFTHDDELAMTQAIQDYIAANALIGGVLYYSKIYAAIVDSVPDMFIEHIMMSLSPPTPVDTGDLTANFWEVYVMGTIEIDYGS